VQQTHNLTNGVKLHRKLTVIETVPNSGGMELLLYTAKLKQSYISRRLEN